MSLFSGLFVGLKVNLCQNWFMLSDLARLEGALSRIEGIEFHALLANKLMVFGPNCVPDPKWVIHLSYQRFRWIWICSRKIKLMFLSVVLDNSNQIFSQDLSEVLTLIPFANKEYFSLKPKHKQKHNQFLVRVITACPKLSTFPTDFFLFNLLYSTEVMQQLPSSFWDNITTFHCPELDHCIRSEVKEYILSRCHNLTDVLLPRCFLNETNFNYDQVLMHNNQQKIQVLELHVPGPTDQVYNHQLLKCLAKTQLTSIRKVKFCDQYTSQISLLAMIIQCSPHLTYLTHRNFTYKSNVIDSETGKIGCSKVEIDGLYLDSSENRSTCLLGCKQKFNSELPTFFSRIVGFNHIKLVGCTITEELLNLIAVNNADSLHDFTLNDVTSDSLDIWSMHQLLQKCDKICRLDLCEPFLQLLCGDHQKLIKNCKTLRIDYKNEVRTKTICEVLVANPQLQTIVAPKKCFQSRPGALRIRQFILDRNLDVDFYHFAHSDLPLLEVRYRYIFIAD